MLKIADFGLATVTRPGVAERLKCGSPGYVAPEVLGGVGYCAKADVFSAGIILCVVLTGVFPFRGANARETLENNKKGMVDLTGSHWQFVSAEAKDLVSKLVAKDPALRYSAEEALKHPWFECAHSKRAVLSNAQENMRKYSSDERRFNVGSIKPEFSMVTCTPLLQSRFAGKDSPLLVPNAVQGPKRAERVKAEERKGGIVIRNISQRFGQGVRRGEEGDLDESEITENPGSRTACSIAGGIPSTAGFVPGKSLMHARHLATPVECKRLLGSPSTLGRTNAHLQRMRSAALGKGLNKEDKLRPKSIANASHDVPLETNTTLNYIIKDFMRSISPGAVNKSVTDIKMNTQKAPAEARRESTVCRRNLNSKGFHETGSSCSVSQRESISSLDKFETAMSHQSSSAAVSSGVLPSCKQQSGLTSPHARPIEISKSAIDLKENCSNSNVKRVAGS